MAGIDPDTKAALTAQLAAARGEIARHGAALRRDLDVAAHLRRSYERHQSAWLVGAAVAGWLLAGSKKGRPEAVASAVRNGRKPRARILKLASFVMFLAKPVVAKVVQKQLASLVIQRWLGRAG